MIRIDDNYIIDADPYNYTVKFDRHKKYYNEKTGTETDVYDTVGHYTNLESALYGTLKDMERRNLAESEHTLKSALKVVRECHRRFTDVMNRVLREEKQKNG